MTFMQFATDAEKILVPEQQPQKPQLNMQLLRLILLVAHGQINMFRLENMKQLLQVTNVPYAVPQSNHPDLLSIIGKRSLFY